MFVLLGESGIVAENTKQSPTKYMQAKVQYRTNTE